MATTKATFNVVSSALASGNATDGYVLTADGSGNAAWEEVAGGPTHKTFGTSSIMIGDNATGTIDAANYNVGLGIDVFAALTSGDNNIAIGFEAVDALTTGGNNVGIGYKALSASNGSWSVAVGSEALKSEATSGSNVAVGGLSMMTSNGASNNVAVGKQTGYLLTTGDYNVFVGSNCAFNQTTASNNVGVGYTALYSCTTGSELVGVGPKALYNATTATSCIAIGDRAFETLVDAPYNVAIGYKSGQNFETGASNEGSCTFVGDSSGRSVTSGKQNTMIGAFAGHVTTATTTGYRNTVVGANAHCNSATGNKEIVMGFATTGIGNGYTTLGSDTARTYNQQGSATWTGTSDERLKENISNLSNSLGFINDLRPVTFNWKTLGSVDSSLPVYREGSSERYQQVNGELPRAGFIAQEVKTVIDNHSEIPNGQKIWHQAPDGIQGTAEGELIPYLVKAIQELSAKNDALEARIETLEG